MPKGKKYKSTERTQDPNKRLAEYKDKIERGLAHYDEQQFITKFAHFMLAEVRNERQMMQELINDLDETFIKFKPRDDS